MNEPLQTIYIVDDDEAVRNALLALLTFTGLPCQAFGRAEDFLALARREMAGCLLLDVRMPGMGGLDLQRRLNELEVSMPTIFLTGHGDVPIAVRAMKEGAMDFIEKPFNEQELIDRVNFCLEANRKSWAQRREQDGARQRFGQLTQREREVMALIAAGLHTKRIAAELDIKERTVDVHRFNIMHKAGARTLAELIQLWSLADQKSVV